MSGKTTNIDIETSNEIMAALNNNADIVANNLTEKAKSQYIKNESSIEIITKKIELCDDGTAKVYCQINSDMDIKDLILILYDRISGNEIFIVTNKYSTELVAGEVYYINIQDNKLATIYLKRG